MYIKVLTKHIRVCYNVSINQRAKARKKEDMNKELLDKTIERNNLYGRSFTYGVAFVTLVRGGYFWNDEGSVEDIEWMLAEHLAAEIDGDAMRIHNKLTLKALTEAVDIAVIDELVTSYVEEAEA